MTAAAGASIGAFRLTADRRRSRRFLNMLRVFKPTSPMSVGVDFFPYLPIGAASELGVALERLRAELGSVQYEPYRMGKAGGFAGVARVLNGAGSFAALVAFRNARIAKLAGTLLLLGGLAERFAVFEAGKTSAENPKFTIESQRPQPR